MLGGTAGIDSSTCSWQWAEQQQAASGSGGRQRRRRRATSARRGVAARHAPIATCASASAGMQRAGARRRACGKPGRSEAALSAACQRAIGAPALSRCRRDARRALAARQRRPAGLLAAGVAAMLLSGHPLAGLCLQCPCTANSAGAAAWGPCWSSRAAQSSDRSDLALLRSLPSRPGGQKSGPAHPRSTSATRPFPRPQPARIGSPAIRSARRRRASRLRRGQGARRPPAAATRRLGLVQAAMTMAAPPGEMASVASGSLASYTFVDEEELLGGWAPLPLGRRAAQAHGRVRCPACGTCCPWSNHPPPCLQASRSGWRSWSCWWGGGAGCWQQPGCGQPLQGMAFGGGTHVAARLHPCSLTFPLLQVGNARGRTKPDPIQCFQLLQVGMGTRTCSQAHMPARMAPAPPAPPKQRPAPPPRPPQHPARTQCNHPNARWVLQKLVVSLDRASRPEVKEFQRRCEEAVVDVLLKGAPPPVRGHARAAAAGEGAEARCGSSGGLAWQAAAPW